jgi:hybrid cluster-associated redox disulfide protein
LRKRKDGGRSLRDPRNVTAAHLLNTLLSDVLAERPAAARVFIDRRMGCVGCAFAPFETVGEAARAYGIEPGELAHALADGCGAVRTPEENDHHDNY